MALRVRTLELHRSRARSSRNELGTRASLALRKFHFSMPYNEWEQLHPEKMLRHVAGERGYQTPSGRPSKGTPCRVKLRYLNYMYGGMIMKWH